MTAKAPYRQTKTAPLTMNQMNQTVVMTVVYADAAAVAVDADVSLAPLVREPMSLPLARDPDPEDSDADADGATDEIATAVSRHVLQSRPSNAANVRRKTTSNVSGRRHLKQKGLALSRRVVLIIRTQMRLRPDPPDATSTGILRIRVSDVLHHRPIQRFALRLQVAPLIRIRTLIRLGQQNVPGFMIRRTLPSNARIQPPTLRSAKLRQVAGITRIRIVGASDALDLRTLLNRVSDVDMPAQIIVTLAKPLQPARRL